MGFRICYKDKVFFWRKLTFARIPFVLLLACCMRWLELPAILFSVETSHDMTCCTYLHKHLRKIVMLYPSATSSYFLSHFSRLAAFLPFHLIDPSIVTIVNSFY